MRRDFFVANAQTIDDTDQDARFLSEAVALARRAEGLTSPNPMVGCVLVHDGKVIGRGWHTGPGTPHAEVAAIADAKTQSNETHGATAYVTLEPCNHHGRTGPCTEALIAAGVAETIFAEKDPNALAAGGAERLAESGMSVRHLPIEETRKLNASWVHGIKTGSSYVLAKAAMSLDGRVATSTGESQWITGPEAREAGHRDRWGVDAMIVGAGTVLADDPSLTARPPGLAMRQPLRVVLDSTARTSPGAKVFERSAHQGNDAPGISALLATTDRAPAARLRAFEEMGVDPLILSTDHDGRPDLTALLKALHQRGVVKVMVEGGGTVLGAFFDQDLIEELALFVAPKLIGGGRPAFAGAGVDTLQDASRFRFDPPHPIGSDILYRGYRQRKESA